MRIGIMFSGIGARNGADFVAEFMINAVRSMGHECVPLGSHGGSQVDDIPEGLDFVVHSSGRCLRPQLVEKFRKKTKVVLWTHNDEMSDWQKVITPITHLVDIHYSYTRAHPYGDHVRYLPLGADHTIYHPLSIEESFYEYDIAMIGARRQWRDDFAEKIIKKYPKAFFHFDMKLSHEEVNAIYNKTRIVLAPVQDCDQDAPSRAWGCPCRTFDVPASGAFQLQVQRGGLAEAYPEAVAIEPIQDVDEAVEVWSDAIEYYLENEDERLHRATMLHHWTAGRHLYRHRIGDMILDIMRTKT